MKDVFLGEQVYENMLNLLNNQYFIEKPGMAPDMDFLSEDWWLRDTAVIEKVVRRAGMWEIQLVFAHHLYPTKLIKRVISRYTCKNKAVLSAWYMRRLAAKDQRGTLQVKLEDFGLCAS